MIAADRGMIVGALDARRRGNKVGVRAEEREGFSGVGSSLGLGERGER